MSEQQLEFDFVKDLDHNPFAQIAIGAKEEFNRIMDEYKVSEQHRTDVAHLCKWF